MNPLPQFPPLRDTTSTLKTANKDKARILAERFYPPPGEADLTDIPGTSYPSEVDVGDEITETDIRRAIKRLPPRQDPRA